MKPPPRSSLCLDCLAIKHAPQIIVLPDHLRQQFTAESAELANHGLDVALFQCTNCGTSWMYARQNEHFMQYTPSRAEADDTDLTESC